ncbi:hypothetical protein EI71_00055 [Anaeroplasma bactoclasticum]|jgi:hypothetical protein|uniref:Uncharacterized protein n=1 Tax=Anaeroplasma bactoclasticum TaxID=2088 RepID=A0A397S860_9MOLU|nr:hypothetical protein [Anaeroplasma bactoclasticum]RIA78494.1 hypothetical protein EI71_00055 [Anaeroplasma bactoclasticum]
MKKRKLIYLLSLATLGASLASCGEARDYKSKNFTVEMPEKNSSATVEYKALEEKNGLVEFYANRIDPSKEGNENIQEDFYKKYQSVMATYFGKTISYSNQVKKENVKEAKSIFDTNSGNLYCYDHKYSKEDGKIISDSTVEMNSINKDGKTTFTLDITLNNEVLYVFNTTGSSIKEIKYVTGSLKLTSTFDFSIDKNAKYYNTLFDITHDKAIAYTSSLALEDDAKIYTNSDKSYLYSIFESTRENNDGTQSTSKYVTSKENYLVTFKGYAHKFGETRENFYNYKYEYFENSLLGDTIDTNGFTAWDNYPLFFDNKNPYPIAFMPYNLSSVDGSCLDRFLVYLAEDEELQAKLTITEDN